MAKFAETFCSQCGAKFGPGDSGFSHCQDHAPMEHAQKIVAEFESIFGKLSATERNWLARRIAEGAKQWADVVLSEENDRLIALLPPGVDREREYLKQRREHPNE